MSRMWWIIILVAAGVGLAVVIGVLGTRNEPSTSKSEEVSSLCASLKTLESSLQTLTGLSSSSSMTEFQADVNAVRTAGTRSRATRRRSRTRRPATWTAPGTASRRRSRTCQTTPRSPTRSATSPSRRTSWCRLRNRLPSK